MWQSAGSREQDNQVGDRQGIALHTIEGYGFEGVGTGQDSARFLPLPLS